MLHYFPLKARIYPVLLLSVVITLLVLSACSTAPSADIVIGADGCSTNSFTLAATREPEISLVNEADVPMVFTLPVMNRWQVLAPGEESLFELPRYIMGDFDFFCLTESDHTLVAGGNPFLCVMEPAQLAPVARSSGIFAISPHDRIKEVLSQP